MSDNPEDRVEDLEETQSQEDQSPETEEAEAKAEAASKEVEEVEEDLSSKKSSYSKDEFDKAVKRRQAALERAQKAEKELKDLRKKHATEEERLKLEAEEKAQAQAAKFKPALVKQHVAYEMAFLGLNKTQIDQVVKFVEMDNIEVDLSDNSVEGVEDEVSRIKQIFPDLFPDAEAVEAAKKAVKQTTAKKKAPRADGADKPKPETPKSAREQIAARLRGGR